MDKLRAMALFKKVAETGSFSQAAAELNVSKSMISKEISKLENQIGSRLLQRNTRQLQLTEIGEGYLKRCRQILMQVKDADSYVQYLQSKPIGKLKINAPMSLGITDLGFVFCEFMQAYPDIALDISLSDEYVDLIEEGYDIGFRAMSQLQDLNYVGKPIAEFKLHIVAAPGYLKSNPEVKNPEDLINHNCFSYSYAADSNSWPINSGVEISGQLSANSTLLLKQAALDGLGIALLPSFVCRAELDSKKLVEILPSCERPSLKFYVLYPAREFVPPKITLCVDFIRQWYSTRKV